MSGADKPAPSKAVVEYGPLLVFLALYKLKDIYWATGGLMIALTLALGYAWLGSKRVPPMLVLTAAIGLPLGALTLWLRDPRFIYLKPTIVYVVLSLVLFGGLVRGRPLLKELLGEQMEMRDEGWRALSLRFAIFWLCLAGANEVMWRTFTPAKEQVWVLFKFPGIPILVMIFLATQLPMMKRHGLATRNA